MKKEEFYVRGLTGIEMDLDTIILIALWVLKYKIAFWILLVLFIINVIERYSNIIKYLREK